MMSALLGSSVQPSIWKKKKKKVAWGHIMKLISIVLLKRMKLTN